MKMEVLFAVISIDNILTVVNGMTNEPVILYGSKIECERYIFFTNILNKTK